MIFSGWCWSGCYWWVLQKCILKNAEKLIELCVTKLSQDWFPLLELLAMVLNPHCKWVEHCVCLWGRKMGRVRERERSLIHQCEPSGMYPEFWHSTHWFFFFWDGSIFFFLLWLSVSCLLKFLGQSIILWWDSDEMALPVFFSLTYWLSLQSTSNFHWGRRKISGLNLCFHLQSMFNFHWGRRKISGLNLCFHPCW